MRIKQDLDVYGKLLREKDLVIGSGGNISVRTDTGCFIKRKYADMAECGEEGYIPVNFADLQQTENIVSSETGLHIGCYEAERDIGAVIHVHSPYMVAVSAKIGELKSTSYEFDCVIGKNIPVAEYLQPGSPELANAVKDLVKQGYPVILLKRHGAVSVGKDLAQAYLRIIALERACITYLFS